MEKAPGICSDAITRIPMIWNWKGHFKDAYVAEELVETVDLTSTLCHLCGLEPLETSDGHNISHLLRGERGEVHRIGVTEFAWSKSVRKDKYRLVFYPRQMFATEYPDGFGELYDIETDQWEINNLYLDPNYQDVVMDLKNELTEWLISTTRPATVLGVEPFFPNQSVTRYKNTVNVDGKINPDLLYEIKGGHYL